MTTYINLPIKIAGQILTVPTAADLPTVCIPEGSIRYIEDTGELVIWDGVAWGFKLDALEVNDLIVNNIALLNAQVVEIGDNCLLLNNDVTGTPTEDAGIEVERGDEPNAQLKWVEADDCWYHGVEGNLFPIPKSSTNPGKLTLNCDVSAAVLDWVVLSQVTPGSVEVVSDNTYDDLILGIICAKPTSITCEVLTQGRIDGLAGLTPGKRAFISTSGVANTSRPLTGSVQVVGKAISATELLVEVSGVKVRLTP